MDACRSWPVGPGLGEAQTADAKGGTGDCGAVTVCDQARQRSDRETPGNHDKQGHGDFNRPTDSTYRGVADWIAEAVETARTGRWPAAAHSC